MNDPSMLIPEADADTATADYATRFAGEVGRWMLDVQYRAVKRALAALPSGPVLDVGGAHAQVAVPLARTGRPVTVTGSSPDCETWLRDRAGETPVAFVAAASLKLPFADRAFPVCLSLRLLTHSPDWRALIAELCRVAERAVILDYPSRHSLNRLAGRLFDWKLKVEKNTRPFHLFADGVVDQVFAGQGFRVTRRYRQFFWPMALHRMVRKRTVAQALEAPAAALGLTAHWGSPVVLLAERINPSSPSTGREG